MATRMTVNGVSICMAGQEYERLQLKIGRKVRAMYQYDYRDSASGELFSCIGPTLGKCGRLRDEWVKTREDRL